MATDREGAGVPFQEPARLWSVDEANRRLDDLRELLPQMRAWVVRLRKVHDELHRLSTFWGREIDAPDHPDRGLKHRLDEEWRELTRQLEEKVDALRGEGIEVKDLESGLIDFYALRDNEVVFLCWQRGEDEVAFFHTLDGGYATRRALSESGARRAPPRSRRGL